MSEVLYLKLNQNTEVHERDVFLGQLGSIWCRDKAIESKCKAIKVINIQADKKERYVLSVMDLIKQMEKLDSRVEINNIGETDCIIDYQPNVKPSPVWDWLKAAAVCIVAFFGAAFAIMTFNNDGDVSNVFGHLYYQVMGVQAGGPTILEFTYSIGLPLGIIVFFNHFSKAALSKDPTPIEVQMRTYETDVNTTLIQNASREESGIDVS
ncbi:stage V sporulation protein AA [Qiania dongpingensis]|uniref:Stage V sporulation protein AA n=1 Tax=Qiania dongpingensis TaxID=2763669 RepID=A0A7G9G7K4_9FIRM|nr:stage V sporulation protein AA [Qiania dongpingensis]QNM06786.1 stage V sporulation protein AA [Qiania dongpingensis]